MAFENIKQLEKEIEEKFEMTPRDYQMTDKIISKLSREEIILLRKIDENNKRKAKFKQLKEVCDEVSEICSCIEVKPQMRREDYEVLLRYLTKDLKELLKKFQGEGNAIK